MIDFVHSHEQRQECVGDVRLGFIVASGFSESQIDGAGAGEQLSLFFTANLNDEDIFAYFYWITI